MALTELRYWSAALGRQVSAMAILPQGARGPFPVWYLLHGLSDDHTAWTRWTSLDRYVAGRPVMIVMPDGGRGWYTDAKARVADRYESAIVRDLIPWVDATFRTRAERSGRVVSGLSMGGYGALKLALKHPHLFCAAASHSGALRRGADAITGTDAWSREVREVFGRRPGVGPEDLFTLARAFVRRPAPALRIDCGRKDFLLHDNRSFHRHLVRLGIPHAYRERPGAHTWDYWDREVQALLPWFGERLGLPAPA